jgi:hypothetical protein
MPNEVIARCGGEQLTVQWTGKDSLDPMVGVGSWREVLNPNGSHADWEPVGPQWALGEDGIDQMIRTLRRAKRAIYPQPAGHTINIHVSGEVSAEKLQAAVQEALLRSNRFQR